MAHIIPSDISQLALAGSREPELDTLRVLKAGLPAAYTVFHGVHWSRSYKGGTCYGEIDFVVINQAGDVLLIEQKNGRLKETSEGLIKTYGQAEKNVGDQLRRSLENVREKFKWQHGDKPGLKLDYLIYCPDYSLTKLNAVGIDANRIIDATTADQLSAKIEDLLTDGGTGNPAWADQVEEFFRQSFELVPNIHAHLSAQEKTFTRLSGGLADIIDNIEMNPLRLRIRGAAGCGKSLVAHRLYDRACVNGRKPLLVCYSRPLRERLNATVASGGMVQTWNGFCDEFLKTKGHRLDYSQMNKDPRFWDKVADLVIAESVPDDWLFDTLIVDEGQDFEEGWVDVLKLFLKPDGDFVWLEDEDQDLYGRHPGPLDIQITYRAKTNYRSPESIARFIRQALPFDFDNANDLPGMGVGLETYEDENDQPKIVNKLVTDLLKRGFRHSDIVVLTCRGQNSSIFGALQNIGSYKLRKFTGEYDMFGNQVLTDGKLYFETIRRFKGQQSPAVILVDVDPDLERLDQQERLLYCGMTRAMVRLELVVKKSNEYCGRFQN